MATSQNLEEKTADFGSSNDSVVSDSVQQGRHQCDLCPRNYKRANELTSHKKWTHTKTAISACIHCKSEFSRPYLLHQHINSESETQWCTKVKKSVWESTTSTDEHKANISSYQLDKTALELRFNALQDYYTWKSQPTQANQEQFYRQGGVMLQFCTENAAKLHYSYLDNFPVELLPDADTPPAAERQH
jgi:uncharacterized protein involved in tolerance to divalent cations